MEVSSSKEKTIERVVSQKALQMGSSFSCQICFVGFLCGVCLTSLFLAALTSLGSFQFGNNSVRVSQWNSSTSIISIFTTTNVNPGFNQKETGPKAVSHTTEEDIDEERISLLYSAWTDLLTESRDGENQMFRSIKLSQTAVPNAPHLENCKLSARVNSRLDTRAENEVFPPWTSWRGVLDMHPESANNEQLRNFRRQETREGSYPPWISGSDEDNYPLTRKVQRDLWLHQHPQNCHDPAVKFLVTDWETLPGFGIGAQFAGMCGLLAVAIKEKRILVTNYYNRADHDGCKGSSLSSWSCYFLPETSQECRIRAFELVKSQDAWAKGIVTGKQNYSSKEIWAGSTPRLWGNPWDYIQPTTEINGTLIRHHRKMDRRWWRAQALRYLMRFQSEYTCSLMNAARHAAFGREAAKMVLSSLGGEWPKKAEQNIVSDIEEYVWSNHKPWIPRPLLSMHVRMGDKACEMKVVGFEEYMHLADRIGRRFPHLNRIWLSTEMQEVIDKSKSYPRWKFYYTNVKRQVGNITMATYEASLGRETSTNYPLVNFLMASDADFFIGALGSTWCFLIDGMRNTGGNVMAGYLSVNKDRFW